MDDTVFNHQIQVETDALDKLVADLTEALQDSAETIQETFENWSKTVKSAIAASQGVNVEGFLDEIINFDLNGAIDEETLAKEIADAEADKQKQIAEQESKRTDAAKTRDTKIANATNALNKASNKLKKAGQTLQDEVNEAYEDMQNQRARYYADSGAGLPVVYTLEEISENYKADLNAAEKKYKRAQAAYDQAKTDYDAVVKESNQTYASLSAEIDEAIRLIEASGGTSSGVSTISTPKTIAGGSTSVKGDLANGSLVSVVTIHDDILNMSDALKDEFKGVNTNVLSVLAESTKLSAFTDKTFSSYSKTMQSSITNMSKDVSTIASNTTQINKQLSNIQTLISNGNALYSKTVQSYSKTTTNVPMTNGLRRVGRTVTYR